MRALDLCSPDPCGTNAICSVGNADINGYGEIECSCPDDFQYGDPFSECRGKF